MDKLERAGGRQHQVEGQRAEAGIDPYGSVGARLRAARLAAGYELSEVAQHLRLRSGHLLAIEEERFDDLPGAVYAVGYLRSYAELLGLDGEAMVRLFKDQAQGFSAPAKLVFPTPSPEGRRPAAALIIASLVAAGAIWAAWHYISARDRVAIEGIPEVPERLITTAAEPTPPQVLAAARAGPEASRDAAGEEAAAEAAAAADGGTPAPRRAGTDEDSATLLVSREGAGAATAPAAPFDAATPAAAPPTAVVELPPFLEVSPAAGGDGYVPQVFGAANKEARVVVRASMDSWIQITGANDELVLTRTLRTGDIFRVPNRADLVMVTGNAGGIEITVDGEPVPPIGPIGAVRRDISLDAERLLPREADGE